MSQNRANAADDRQPHPFEGMIGRRVVAWLIDGAILFILSWLVWGGTGMLAVLTLGLTGGLFLLPWGLVLPILYGTIAIGSPLSATPGQALMGLVVRSESDTGHPTFGQAFTSTTLLALSWAAGGVPLLAAFFSTRSRTLHDLFSDTIVVRSAALQAVSRAGRNPGRIIAEDG